MNPIDRALPLGRTVRWSSGLLVGLVGLSLYLVTLAPGLTWAHDSADGGELATAAVALGIAHPPGYPTYLLLAHPFTRLPIGEVATRTNLFSALCAALACALLAAKVMDATGRWTVSIGTGLALAVSPLLWSQATVTEVHTLNGLFGALLLALVPRSQDTRSPAAARSAAVIGVAWGLSMGNHPTAIFYFPLVALALWRLEGRRWVGVVGIVLGLLVYLYLPLCAASVPPVNWGNPGSVQRLWWMMSGVLYHPFLFALPRAYLPARLSAWASLMAQQLGWVGIPLVALGGVTLWKRHRPLLLATATTVVLCSGFGIGYDASDSYLYLIPALVSVFFWLALGANWVLDRIEETGRYTWASAVVVALIALIPLIAALLLFPDQDLSEDRTAYAFASTVLGQAPTQAILLSQKDAHTFALWYFMYALGRRTDVTVIDLGLLGQEWYVAQLTEQLGASVAPLLAREPKWQQVTEHLNRPVCTISSQSIELSCLEPRTMEEQ